MPDGWEAVVSSAYPSVPGLRRSEFLRELVSARPSIVVAGTHGKGTTAAMVAYVLRETGRDPAWLIGAPVPQLGSNAGFGAGYLVVEGDESDRTVFGLDAEVAVVTNVELDHHTEFASQGELLERVRALARGSAARRARCARVRRRAGAARRAQPAERRRGARRPRSGRRAARRCRDRARAVHGHRATVRGARARGHVLVDDYGHHPTEIAATIQAVRERLPRRRSGSSSSRTSTRAPATSPGSSQERWPAPTTSRSPTSMPRGRSRFPA